MFLAMSIVMRWNQNPIKLERLTLSYLNPAAGQEQIYGIGQVTPTPAGLYFVQFSAVTLGNIAFVRISLGKKDVQSLYPHESVEVAERFPPLRARLGGIARNELFAEIGRVLPNFLLPLVNRDQIVISELLSRGALTEAELSRIILEGGIINAGKVDAEALNQRVIALTQVLEQRNEASLYAASLGSAFLGVSLPRAMQGGIMSHVVFHDGQEPRRFFQERLLIL